MKNSPLPKGKDVVNHQGKNHKCDYLPSRFAMDTVTGGDPMRRFRNDYGKKTHEDETGLNILPIGSVNFPVRQ